MQTSNFWNQFHLQGQKVRLMVLACLAILLLPNFAEAQRQYWFESQSNGQTYGQDAGPALRKNKRRMNRPLAFGFFGGVMKSGFNVKFEQDYITNPIYGQVLSINPKSSIGFALGLYANVRISEFWDFRINAQAAFLERKLEYLPSIGDKIEQTVEGAMLEVPLLFKYRSQIRGITGMYLVGGIKPSIALNGKKTASLDKISQTSADVSLEYGLGFDAFFPFFKFAPELRFSHGLTNVLNKSNQDGALDQPLQRLSTHTATLYFHFGG